MIELVPAEEEEVSSLLQNSGQIIIIYVAGMKEFCFLE